MSKRAECNGPRGGCLCDLNKSGLKTDNFLLKVLTAMNELQSNNSCFRMGIGLYDIVNYMQERFCLDGDLHTQVHISLQQACHHGFAIKQKNKFKLVGPMAKVVGIPHTEAYERDEHIRRAQAVFWNTRGKAGMRKKRDMEFIGDDDFTTTSTCNKRRYSSRSRSMIRNSSLSRIRGSTSSVPSCCKCKD